MPARMIGDELFEPEWLDQVVSTPDGELRGHMVALTYHHYATLLDAAINLEQDSVRGRLKARMPIEEANANWFNFATWATATVNRNIRARSVPYRSDVLLPFGLRKQLTPLILQAKARGDQRVARALAWAQRLVFLSATRGLITFRPFIEAGDPGSCQFPADVKQQLMRLSEWDGKAQLQHGRHLAVIEQAFGYFAQARRFTGMLRSLPEGKPVDVAHGARVLRSRYIYFGNLLITAVEQDVVNHAVRTVVEHLPRTLMSLLDEKAGHLAEVGLGVPRQLASFDFAYRLGRMRSLSVAGWSRFMTDQIIVLALPSETLRLGRDVPPREPGKHLFPRGLRGDLACLPEFADRSARLQALRTSEEDVITHMQDLRDYVDMFDRSQGNGVGSAARDWRRYDERMSWATTMFRSRQQDPTLFWSPYTESDRRRIFDGELPLVNGDPVELEVQAPLDGAFEPGESYVKVQRGYLT